MIVNLFLMVNVLGILNQEIKIGSSIVMEEKKMVSLFRFMKMEI